MNSSKTDLAQFVDSVDSPTVFFCPAKTVFTWILGETSAFYISIITKSIASPITVLLNILVIVAVNTRKELYKNSNILLASMAVADLIVGAVSMSLTTSYDILLLRKDLSIRICVLAMVNRVVVYTVVSSSLYHLTVIAIERYVAIKMWRSYKVLITKARVKFLAFIAWLLAILTSAPTLIMEIAEVDHSYIKIASIISGVITVACVAIIGYCYTAAYLSMSRKKGNEISEVVARSKAKMESTIARATLILTTVLLICYIPSILLLLLEGTFPIFRTSSYFRWVELLLQLNSLLNPFLYCFFLNHNFRKEVLEMMKIRKPDEGQPPVRRPRRIVPPTAFVEVQEIQEEAQQPDKLNSIELPDADRPMPYNMNNQANVERAMLCPARIGTNEFVEQEQELVQDDDQQPGCINRAMSWDSMDLANTVYQGPYSTTNQPKMKRQMPPSSFEGNQVICVDVHRPTSTKRKPWILVAYPLSSEERQKNSENGRHQEPPSYSTREPVMERSIPISSTEGNTTIVFDAHPSSLARQKPPTSSMSWHGSKLNEEYLQGFSRPETR